ncbi:MarR family transcriptional regulator [Halobellus sp. Atlit-31R]|nr:MarR family transcriptional regulator [Halobellus sp. Atlit-31R]
MGTDARQTVAELSRDERVELGVDLLAHVEAESFSLSAAVDRIETVTTNPALTREILDTAELRGIIERGEGRLRTRRGGTFVRFEQQVIEREGDYRCRRCGASLSTGHFVQFESGELGPFGPSCVRKVLGRE